MSDDRKRPDNGISPSFTEPLRHALDLMQDRELLTPDQHKSRAKRLLFDRFETGGQHVQVAFSNGSAGIQADHTHYFNGFALLKPMRRGTAVAVRFTESNEVRITLEGVPDTYAFELGAARVDTDPAVVQSIRVMLESMDPEMRRGLDVALVSTIPEGLVSSSLASAGTATVQAVLIAYSREMSTKESSKLIKRGLETVLHVPVSAAYIIAATAHDAKDFVLVDTETFEYLSIDVPDRTGPGWVLVDTATSKQKTTRNTRSAWSQEILERLRQKKFTNLKSLRDLEHRDLETAVSVLPRKMRPGLRYLVTENRRVQRLVVAIRNRDWQLMGALLKMSHASKRDDWSITSPMEDFVVAEAERFSLEGVYGATQTGEGSFILIAGQPFRLPAFLDNLRSNWPAQASAGPDTFIL